MFERINRRFLDNTFDHKPSVQTVPKKIIYFCLPFTGIHSLQIRTQINCLCNAASLISILDSFSAPPDESLLFSLLRINFPSTCDLVMFTLFKCGCCSASYVGQTTSHIYTLDYQSTWVSLLLRENIPLTPLSPVCFPTRVLLVTKWTLTISKSFLPVPTRMS